MPYHSDLISPQGADHDICTPLLKAGGQVRTRLAGAALRSLLGLAQSAKTSNAILDMGRLLASQSIIPSNTNLHADTPTPPPIQVLTTRLPENDRAVALYLFTDRSCFVTRQSEAVPNMVEILPVILKLSGRVRIHSTDRRYVLNVSPSSVVTEKAEIMIAPGDQKHTVFEKFFDRTAHHGFKAGDFACIEAALGEEIESWGRTMDKTPMIVDPERGPRKGILGVDIAAPHPNMAGRPYIWPAAFSYQNIAMKDYDAAQPLLHLAFVAIHDEAALLADDFALIVNSPVPAQGCANPRMPEIMVRAVASPQAHSQELTNKDIETRIAQLYREKLRHPSMPPWICKMIATTSRSLKQSPHRSNLSGYTFYSGRMNESISAHDRLAAQVKFN